MTATSRKTLTGIMAMLGLTLLLGSPAVLAKSVYVDDNLRVGVRTQPGSRDASIAVISSGAKVEVLQRRGGYLKIRTRSGIEGWVKAAYFSKGKPAVERLRETRDKLKALQAEVRELKNSSPRQQALLQQYKLEIEKLRKEKQDLQNMLDNNAGNQPAAPAPVSSENPSPLQQLLKLDSPLGLFAIAIIVMLALGFLLGVGWHKHQVTKRLGGLTL